MVVAFRASQPEQPERLRVTRSQLSNATREARATVARARLPFGVSDGRPTLPKAATTWPRCSKTCRVWPKPSATLPPPSSVRRSEHQDTHRVAGVTSVADAENGNL